MDENTEQAATAAETKKEGKPAKVRAPKAKGGRKSAKHARKTARPAKAREQVLAMISRKGGATLREIAKKMSYELHTVRGMVSIFGSRDELKINSEKVDGERTYKLR